MAIEIEITEAQNEYIIPIVNPKPTYVVFRVVRGTELNPESVIVFYQDKTFRKLQARDFTVI